MDQPGLRPGGRQVFRMQRGSAVIHILGARPAVIQVFEGGSVFGGDAEDLRLGWQVGEQRLVRGGAGQDGDAQPERDRSMGRIGYGAAQARPLGGHIVGNVTDQQIIGNRVLGQVSHGLTRMENAAARVARHTGHTSTGGLAAARDDGDFAVLTFTHALG